jgi:kynureninase
MITRTTLEQYDETDPLAPFRDRFHLPLGVIYLDGNSLGPLPRATPGRIAELVQQEWGQGLIRSWNDAGWISLADRVAANIAHLIGAPQGSVVVADSTSINLFKLLGAALNLQPGRHTIISERGTFPTDLYIAQGLTAFLGNRHTLRLVEPNEIPTAIDDDTAIVLLTHVNYRTGALHDMAALTRSFYFYEP